MAGDPDVNDDQRKGDDLIERIIELEADGTGNGWRYLLKACGAEIMRLRHELEIAEESREDEGRYAPHHGARRKDYEQNERR